jgi:pimeloyl-ACP methyl ester carboxylesterase
MGSNDTLLDRTMAFRHALRFRPTVRRLLAGSWVLGLALLISTATLAQPPAPNAPLPAVPPAAEAPAPTRTGLLEILRTKTLGGVQLWGDELYFHEWRIQRNSFTGHCRLLDGNDDRFQWGTFDTCLAELDRIKREKMLPSMSGKALILLHGLAGWRGTMAPLGDYLKEHNDYPTVINVSYPSTRKGIAQDAQALDSIISHLDGITEIDIVAHSLGNLIVRYYLGEHTDPAKGLTPDPRIKRFVMLAPPNHGAQRANDWADSELFKTVLGEAAVELGPGWAKIEPKLATPTCEFGIIAGGLGDDDGYSSSLAGDDDLMLSVATTRLVGARDFVVVPAIHAATMVNPRVMEYTSRFLEYGYFISEDRRQPILPPPAKTP